LLKEVILWRWIARLRKHRHGSLKRFTTGASSDLQTVNALVDAELSVEHVEARQPPRQLTILLDLLKDE